jgi:hypothetical protein
MVYPGHLKYHLNQAMVESRLLGSRAAGGNKPQNGTKGKSEDSGQRADGKRPVRWREVSEVKVAFAEQRRGKGWSLLSNYIKASLLRSGALFY